MWTSEPNNKRKYAAALIAVAMMLGPDPAMATDARPASPPPNSTPAPKGRQVAPSAQTPAPKKSAPVRPRPVPTPFVPSEMIPADKSVSFPNDI
jgi:hypothetical protein